jgi:sugar lactone lactonase YvrE
MKHIRTYFVVLATLICWFVSVANGQTNLGGVEIGRSVTDAVTVSIPAAATISSISVLTQGATDLDFTAATGGTCTIGKAYAANASCTVEVTFTPKFPGTRLGAIVLSSSSGPVATALVIGTGLGPQSVLRAGLRAATPPSTSYATRPIFGVAVDGKGNAYLANPTENSVSIYTLSTAYELYSLTSTVGSGLSAPTAVAIDAAGNIDIADTGNGRIVQEALSAGTYVQTTIASGFKSPVGLAIDTDGNLYVADQQAGAVYKEHPAKGSFTETTLFTGLNSPNAIAVDTHGNLYIAEDGTTLLKETLSSGSYTRSTITSDFLNLVGVAADAAGNIYLSTSTQISTPSQGTALGTLYIEEHTASGYTLEEFPYSSVFELGGLSAGGIALDPAGDITIVDEGPEYPTGYYTQLDYQPAKPGTYNFASTLYDVPSADSPRTYALINYGNAALKIGAITYPKDFPEESGVTTDCAANSSLAAGGICTLTVEFIPDSMISDCPEGACDQSVTVESNTLNKVDAMQTIGVSGSQASPTATVTIASTATAITSVFPITYTIQVTGVAGFPAPTGNVEITSNIGESVLAPINSSGQYSFTVNGVAAGFYTVTAMYEGDTYYGNGASASYNQIVVGNTVATSTAPLSLANVDLGSSETGTVNFTFTKPETLGSISVVTGGKTGLEFTNAGTGTCTAGKLYAVRASCTVHVLFTPLYLGQATGAVLLKDSSGNVVSTAYVRDTGIAPALNFLGIPQNIYATNNFDPPNYSVIDVAGNLDFYYNSVDDPISDGFDRLTPSGGTYTLGTMAGSGVAGNGPEAIDGAGYLYVGGYRGTPVSGGYSWTPFTDCCLNIAGIAVDGRGIVYILDAGGQSAGDYPITYPPAIYKEAPSNGSYIQTVIPGAWSAFVSSLAVDSGGNLYVSDEGTYNRYTSTGNGVIYKYAPQTDGSYLESTIDAGNWYDPQSLVIDRLGNLYVANDQYYWGTSGEDGPLYGYWFLVEEALQPNGTFTRETVAQDTDSISALSVDPTQSLFFGHTSDGVNANDWNSMVKFTRSPNAVLTFAETAQGTESSTGIQTLTLQNNGSATTTITAITYPADFPHASGVKTDCVADQKLAANQTCTVSIEFDPVAALGSASSRQLNEVVTVKAMGASASTSTNEVSVSGLELKP